MLPNTTCSRQRQCACVFHHWLLWHQHIKLRAIQSELDSSVFFAASTRLYQLCVFSRHAKTNLIILVLGVNTAVYILSTHSMIRFFFLSSINSVNMSRIAIISCCVNTKRSDSFSCHIVYQCESIEVFFSLCLSSKVQKQKWSTYTIQLINCNA